MLKFRFIFTSFLFLLLLGMNSHVRASVAPDEVVENSTDDKQSEKESDEQEPDESFKNLDFFGAFSLVNVQLQWRDLSGDLIEEESSSEDSWNPKELFVDGVELFSSDSSNDIVSTPSFVSNENFFVPLSASTDREDNTDLSVNYVEQTARTIAYIQNSGTYPKS